MPGWVLPDDRAWLATEAVAAVTVAGGVESAQESAATNELAASGARPEARAEPGRSGLAAAIGAGRSFDTVGQAAGAFDGS